MATEFSTHPKARIGAAIVKGGSLIAVGFNREDKKNSQSGYYDFHAEQSAILSTAYKYGVGYDLRGCKLYVVRVFRNGELSMSKPCSVCSDLIRKSGIRKVYYTNWEGKVQSILPRNLPCGPERY